MKRRAIVLGGAALALAGARAFGQSPGKTYRVGVLLPMAGLAGEPYVDAIRERLAWHGLAEGRNLRLDLRYAGERADARELAASKADAFLVCTSILTVALNDAAQSVPIVFAWVADPVFSGIVPSYSRPGRNVTGVANRFFELARKRVELVRELLPAAKRVAMAAGTFDETIETAMRQARGVAQRLGMQLLRAEAAVDWTGAIEKAVEGRADAVLVLTPFAAFGMRWAAQDVARVSVERRLPVVYSDIESVELGGLVSYGSSLIADVRQAADLLARVLKGEKPADIPIEQAARFELAVNLKTARAIGLEIPRSILLRADRVVE